MEVGVRYRPVRYARLFKSFFNFLLVVIMIGMNPRQMKKLMRQMGISMEEMEGVEEVIIKMKGKEIVLKNPSVVVISAQGEKSYQIVPGDEEIRELYTVSEEDVRLIMEQTGVSEEMAKKALEETKGDIAEAIIKLMEP